LLQSILSLQGGSVEPCNNRLQKVASDSGLGYSKQEASFAPESFEGTAGRSAVQAFERGIQSQMGQPHKPKPLQVIYLQELRAPRSHAIVTLF
jgi:hypothetical protein